MCGGWEEERINPVRPLGLEQTLELRGELLFTLAEGAIPPAPWLSTVSIPTLPYITLVLLQVLLFIFQNKLLLKHS